MRHQHARGIVLELDDPVETERVVARARDRRGDEGFGLATERVGRRLVVSDPNQIERRRAGHARQRLQILVRHADEHEPAAPRGRRRIRRHEESLPRGGAAAEQG